MSNNKQSSVEWLWSELRDKFSWETGEMYDSNELLLAKILEQAKAMHKEEIKKSYTTGFGANLHQAEHYYNETFGGNNEQQ